jgi:hypothetical protein
MPNQVGQMFNLEIPSVNDVIVGELAERGEWVLANVQTGATWPVNSQKVIYRGDEIWIMPVMTDRFPAVAMKVPPGRGRAECERLLLRFLSTLSWVMEAGFLVDGVGGGSVPNPMGRKKEGGYSICEEFDLSYFPEPTDERAMLALALMREGRGLNHPGYSFLSLYRILEVALGRGWQRQVAWINDQIAIGLHPRVKDALEELRKQGVADIGAHLYGSGRCAMAHASGDPVIDPDDPADARRLWFERPIMLALAERAIEEVFGVETRATQYRKHLYELDGFKRIFGDKLVNHLARGDDLSAAPMVDIPVINVELRRQLPFAPLSNLSPKEMQRDSPHSVVLIFESPEGRTKFRFRLDFADERLVFRWDRDIGHTDFGDADSAEAMAEIARFNKEYFGNGQLRIVDAETGDLISRKDAFIPMNMYLDHETADAEIARWKGLAAQRRERDARYANEVARHSQGYEVKIV